MLIILGVELRTPEGDLTILGTADLPIRPRDVKDVISFAKERNGIVPCSYREHGLGGSARNYEVDAIETMAREMGLLGVAGSDAHNPDELWSVCTEI